VFESIPKIRCDPDRLQWKWELGTPKERRYVRVAGAGPLLDVVPFTNDLTTLMRAVTERVFLVKGDGCFQRPPRPEPGCFFQALDCVWTQLVPLLPSTAPVSHQDFVDRYSGRKKEMYQRALEEIRTGRTTLKEDAEVKVFVKYEKTDHTNKVNPVPRVISPRNPRFNIRVGRYLSPLEERLFKSLGLLFHDEHPTVIKGFNASESARVLREKWDMFCDPVAVGLDASRFDQHVSSEALKWEHGVYLNCFGAKKHKKRLSRLLSYQLVNRCSGETPDGKVKYTVNGTRMSGDMNTSLGNCVLMCSMMKAYFIHKNVDAQLANNGDDCVVFLERSQLEHFMLGLTDWFLKLGFNMAVETPVDVFEHVEFCQTKPVFDGFEWIMCRNPHTALAKDSVMLKTWDGPSVFRGWLDAVGTGGLALTGRLPVFQAFYRSYVRSGKKRNIPKELLPWSFTSLCKGMKRTTGIVSPEARCSFWDAFDITPDEQVALEEYYDSFMVAQTPGEFRYRPVF
jgi:hypothetical protein